MVFMLFMVQYGSAPPHRGIGVTMKDMKRMKSQKLQDLNPFMPFMVL